MLIKLLRGVLKFNKEPYVVMEELFKQLNNGQNPETYFITCIDSRIDTNLITQTNPGELLVTRNPGNIIPPHSAGVTSEAAAIEFALQTFDIKDIIICGHAKCGAMKGLLNPELAKQSPTLAAWLAHAAPVLKRMQDNSSECLNDFNEKVSQATQENIKLQIEHLKTYPHIADKLARNELTLQGWLYDIGQGKIFIYEQKTNKFISPEEALPGALEARRNKIVNAVAMEYLEKLAHRRSTEDYQSFKNLLGRLEENILEIWEPIKDAVQQKMWAELSDFFTSATDSEFIALLESCPQIKLADFKKLQFSIPDSEGYQHYANQSVNIRFFSSNMPLNNIASKPPYNTLTNGS